MKWYEKSTHAVSLYHYSHDGKVAMNPSCTLSLVLRAPCASMTRMLPLGTATLIGKLV